MARYVQKIIKAKIRADKNVVYMNKQQCRVTLFS
jgi:hypothetical protein